MRFRQKRVLAVLLVLAMSISVLTGGIVWGDDDNDISVTRLAGADRFETAAEIALEAYSSADDVIIAEGFEFADGLAGSVLAAEMDAPVLLTRTGSLPDSTADAITELGASNATILGGEVAVSAEVAESLEDLDLDVERIAGGDRTETAALIAQELEDVGTKAFVVGGWAPADSLAISSEASRSGVPILQVRQDEVPEATEDVLDELGIEDLQIIGGPAVVSEDVENELGDLVSGEVERMYGATRYATCAAVATEFFEEPDTVIFAAGANRNLADAMAGGYFGALYDAPILYTQSDGLCDDISDYFDSFVSYETEVFIMGGTAAVSSGVQNEIEGIIGEYPEPRFTGTSAEEGSKDITLYFNTPVYDPDGNVDDDDFNVEIEGEEVGVDEIGIATSRADAEDKFTLTLDERPDEDDRVVVYLQRSGTEKITNLRGVTIASPEVHSAVAVKGEHPSFVSILPYAGTRVVYAEFSMPVNTENYDTGETIYDAVDNGLEFSDFAEVSGAKEDQTPLVFDVEDIECIREGEELEEVKLTLGSQIPEDASEITVEFKARVANYITSEAGLSLAGTYSRTAAPEEGPYLDNATVSDLGVNLESDDEGEQTFSVRIMKKLPEGELLTVDVTDADEVYYDNAEINIKGDSWELYDLNEQTIKLEAQKEISHRSTVEITAVGVETGAAEEVEVDFMRSDVEATDTAKFNVVATLDDYSITFEHDGDFGDGKSGDADVLYSGQQGYDEVEITFDGGDDIIEEGESVTIDMSNLVAAGVDLSNLDVDETDVTVYDDGGSEITDADLELEISDNVLEATVEVDNDDDGIYSAEIIFNEAGVEVAEGSAAKDIGVDFTRSDSGVTETYRVDILGTLIVDEDDGVEGTSVHYFEFTLDGKVSRGNSVVISDTGHSYLSDNDNGPEVVEGEGKVRIANGDIRWTAPDGGTDCGTKIVIAAEVDGAGGEVSSATFERKDSGFELVW